ncbi:MAG: hypothetical protein RSE65_07635, partial [Hafnia sp.]
TVPSWGVGGQRLAPQLGRLHGVYVGFGTLGVRNHTQPHSPFPIPHSPSNIDKTVELVTSLMMSISILIPLDPL